MSKMPQFDINALLDSESRVAPEVDERFCDSPATQSAIVSQKEKQATHSPTWDFLITEARLLQQPDLMAGGWINSGGFFDRSKAKWFNSEGAKGVPLAILYDVVVGRCIELEIPKSVVDTYVARRGRSIAAEEAFFRLSFDARMAALRQGEAL
jgi:hypothetical protein